MPYEEISPASVKLLRIEERQSTRVATSGVDSDGNPIVYLFIDGNVESIVLDEYNGYHVFALTHDGDYINVVLIKET